MKACLSLRLRRWPFATKMKRRRHLQSEDRPRHFLGRETTLSPSIATLPGRYGLARSKAYSSLRRDNHRRSLDNRPSLFRSLQSLLTTKGTYGWAAERRG